MGKTAADRSSRPHVNCVKVTPDQKYLCAVDGGLDHVKVYKIDYENGKLRLADIVHSDLDSAPKMIRFSKDGKNAYILSELENSGASMIIMWENTERNLNGFRRCLHRR